MPTATLDDRALISVSGPDAEHFLQNILTVDLDALGPGEAKPGALLTPQGKILFDFLVSRDGAGGFILECRADVADDFVRRLMLYRLRAKVDIAKLDQGLVEVRWGDYSGVSAGTDKVRLRDSRFTGDPVDRLYGTLPPPLTQPGRVTGLARPSDPLKGEGDTETLTPPSPQWGGIRGGGEAANNLAADWHAFRIGAGVPESGDDFALGDAFPHDALLDQLGGVGFRKGCYVGQEVVSRMQHRGTARRRFMIVQAQAALPAPGTEFRANGRVIGMLGSVAGSQGLALVRIDKVKAALDAGMPILADGVALDLSFPAFVTFGFPQDMSAVEEG